ncbi:MAG: hypothetical protein IH623_21895 [Verrucomicrobia bacterium]|nr:hypothetical protein [Verrucomicrobiota bacterium]
MSGVQKRADAVIEPELRELCGELTAAERMKTAEKFLRWVDQLTHSVSISNPGLLKVLPPPKVPRGFFLLNLAKDMQDRLRQAAHECGCVPRDVLYAAATSAVWELEEKVRVARLAGMRARDCWELGVGSDRN